jgi:tetraacyldisaccharide 4'-kinase
MKTPLFWSNSSSLLAKLLSPLGSLYGAITLWRMKQRGFKLSIPVICVGNPTVGGQGKTPTAIAIAKLLIDMGKNPVFLTRGYGSSNKGVTLVQAHHTARQVGDEPLILAKVAPVIVSKNKVLGAKFAVKQGFDCIIMDDGFQNPTLHKNYSILLIGEHENQGIFPAGSLRAPLKPQIDHADLTLVMGDDVEIIAEKPFDDEYIAFCGLGNPDKFKATLAKLNVRVRGFHAFPDHHYYTERDTQMLLSQGFPLITTEKDGVKLSGKLKESSVILPITLKFKDEKAILHALGNIFSQ